MHVRGPGFDENPLRRTSDRVQDAARVVMALVFLVGCVAAVVSGRHAYERQRVIEELDARYGYQVQAKVLSTSAFSSQNDGAVHYTSRLAWYDKQGRRHVDTFSTTVASNRAGTLKLWIDHRGQASTRPLSSGHTTTLAIFQGFTTILYVSAFLGVAYAGLLAVLNRRRAAAWEREWAVVEPRWRRQVL